MPACEGCHKAKVKCDLQEHVNSNDQVASSSDDDPASPLICSRCKRLSIVCVRRISRQGQRPTNSKKRKLPLKDEDDGLAKGSVDCKLGSRILKELNSDILKRHFGVKFIIHHWTSLAFSRRSFSLLSRASKLAAKANVSMDSVFSNQRREVLDTLIWQRRDGSRHNNAVPNSNTYHSPLQWSDIPQRLRELSQMPTDPNDEAFQQQRYFWVRESKDGMVRFLVTQVFSDEIASQWLLDQTFQSNQQSIIQLVTEGPADAEKLTGALQYSLARYTEANTAPIRVRANGMKVRYRSKPKASPNDIVEISSSLNVNTAFREMDMLACIEIVSLDHSFYVAEFIPSSKESAPTKSKGNQVGRPNGGITIASSPSSPLQATSPLLDFTSMNETGGDHGSFVSFDGDTTLLEALEFDEDLQHIFDLISD
jgi:hypothetical protein